MKFYKFRDLFQSFCSLSWNLSIFIDFLQIVFHIFGECKYEKEISDSEFNCTRKQRMMASNGHELKNDNNQIIHWILPIEWKPKITDKNDVDYSYKIQSNFLTYQ